MAALFKHRKVNMLELFFDLVFVNAISNLTSVICHLDNGIINPIDYIHYLVSFFVFITIWITETLYLNRYGEHKYRDSFFLLVNMFLLLYLSNSAHRDWRMVFIPYSGILIVLELTMLCQYAIKYFEVTDSNDKKVIKACLLFLSVYPIFLFVGNLFTSDIGTIINVLGLFTASIVPVLLYRTFQLSPVHFPHLIERHGLLVIIVFGEMIIGISDYFDLLDFNIQSVFIFLMVVSIFLLYMEYFDRMLEQHQKTNGMVLMYSHVPLVLSLGTMTVALGFFKDEEANLLFAVVLLYFCLIVYFCSIWFNHCYLQEKYMISRRQLLQASGLFIMGFVICIIFYTNVFITLAVTSIFTTVLTICLYLRNRKVNQ